MEVEEVIKLLKHRNIFITGGGGVGKSYLINQLKERLNLALTSTTGVSAVNINGQTIHSWAGIGIGDKAIESVVWAFRKNRRKRASEIQRTQYLVIDEISMLDAYTFEYIDQVLRGICEIDEPFGGIRIILVGDFFQLPPVKIGQEVEKNNAKRIVDYCFNSPLWKELNLEIINLTKVYRQSDKKFVTALNDIRHGNCSSNTGKLISSRNDKKVPKDTLKLYGLNSSADAENEKRFKELPGRIYTYHAIDLIRCYANGQYKMVKPNSKELTEFDLKKYNTFDNDCRVPKELKLKVGARVMLLYNKNVLDGLVNGTCGYVRSLDKNSIQVEFDNGLTSYIEPQKVELKDGNHAKISREQYPLRLAYGITSHKAQGMTLDRVYVDCENIFAPGQCYVALSRVKTLDGLYLKGFKPYKVFADEQVKEFYNGVENGTN